MFRFRGVVGDCVANAHRVLKSSQRVIPLGEANLGIVFVTRLLRVVVGRTEELLINIACIHFLWCESLLTPLESTKTVLSRCCRIESSDGYWFGCGCSFSCSDSQLLSNNTCHGRLSRLGDRRSRLLNTLTGHGCCSASTHVNTARCSRGGCKTS